MSRVWLYLYAVASNVGVFAFNFCVPLWFMLCGCVLLLPIERFIGLGSWKEKRRLHLEGIVP